MQRYVELSCNIILILTSFTQDPYILRNHLGSLECRLCLTLHTNEGSYLAHTQGKKHQTNLARRAARDMKETQLMIAPTAQSTVTRKVFLKIGRPGYRVTKIRDREEGKEGMMVQIHLPQIKPDVIPRRRFMSAWEQKREPPNRAYQYLIVSFNSYLGFSHLTQSVGRSGTLRDYCLQNTFARD